MWIDLGIDTAVEFARVAHAFGLHHLAVEDAVLAHSRAKLDRYGDVVHCVLRPAEYDGSAGELVVNEIHVFQGPHFVITVRHGHGPDLQRVHADLEARPEILRRGAPAVLHSIIDRVVDDYAPVALSLQDDVDAIEDQLFSEESRVASSRRIYMLTREVIAFQRAIIPLPAMLDDLIASCSGAGGDEEALHLRDVKDHVLHECEMADAYRVLLGNLLSVNLTIETKSLGERSHAQDIQMKKISSWAAIIFAPTLIAGIYGMNFDIMPELHWRYGYPFAITLMLLMAGGLYLIFKNRDWL